MSYPLSLGKKIEIRFTRLRLCRRDGFLFETFQPMHPTDRIRLDNWPIPADNGAIM